MNPIHAFPPLTGPVTKKKIVSAVVQFVETEYDAHGDPVNERLAQPMKLFRAGHPDIWAYAETVAANPPEG